MLNAMRYGKLDEHTIAEFRKLSRRVVYNDGIEPTEL
jgi:ATP-dependent DNA helicase PIF1